MKKDDTLTTPDSPENVSLFPVDSSAHPLKVWDVSKGTQLSMWQQRQAVAEVAHADPNHVQEVAAAQLASTNSYYQSSLHQAQQSLRWSLFWSGVGCGFLLLAVGALLFRQAIEIAYVSAFGGVLMEACAVLYLRLYKDASDQL